MEHSALHALQLVGLLLALAGPLLVVTVIRPARRKLGSHPERDAFANALEQSVARWVCFGALAGAAGALLDFFIQTAELKGKTLLDGVDLALLFKFATRTLVGRLELARAAALLLTAGAARFGGKLRWWLALPLSAGALVLAAFVSHAAAQPIGRFGAIATQILHLGAGGVWLGMLVQLLAARRLFEAAATPERMALTAEVIRRFSPFAMAAVALLGLSGFISVYRFVREPAALLTSAYGLTLLLKLSLLGIAFYAGYRNYAVLRPALLQTHALQGSLSSSSSSSSFSSSSSSILQTRTRTRTRTNQPTLSGDTVPPSQSDLAEPPRRQSLLKLFGRTLELEVTAGLLAVTVAGVLGSVSPPGQAGTQRLTAIQAEALLRPHLPQTSIVNPQTFYGAPDRTLNDLRYSEFMHNWSGVAVCLVGLCWLAHSLGGKLGDHSARLWPGVLVLFGIFIGLASDPEVWLLRLVSLRQVAGDPQLLEHQLGAGLVFLMAWLSWRSRRKPQAKPLLGYALPVIMICGSLLLLGHAHSTLNASSQLANLINVQHAVFGAFGLTAGTVRWLSLRALITTRAARWIWPSLIIGLGLFMAFCYREAV